ncbi:GNAT family N-acetyltransferase [Amnibacterium kyonggiense]|uniref:Aminoglycoside 6'-N-acetyltransferase n=1 Tax=Amnibacterium kyonggiense TaxID=595671 RepID=A0A4R7FQN0_9MICO|nr:GNAT family N-acetyltransferase [Amnibacterium kyonggiense]TDS80090.1 aminoglycoside 6'-N-acetyltransferase [Amnibacterium kyonggiense]
MEVTLRPLTRADLALLGTWLREPLVAEWWHDDPNPAALERQYGPSIDGRDPTVLRMGEVDGVAAGFVQWYRWADEPDWAAELAPFLRIPDDAWSLDYLVGEPTLRRRGIGTALVRAALERIGPAPVVVPVQAGNAGSIALLRRAGFAVVAHADLEPDNPAHGRDHVVLARA